ncbi:serine/threonine protein phosphatase 1 [Neorhizobium galegae]|uniref:metallophosphoesterase family protein n=1 Tax=Neorhizobium galegae TaxID=399 RepID=UPI001FD9C1DA|nr:metallophosphoesterase family protein [Neorhizobium galegae]MBP2547969.1 serine/threonine protein phosphatase 1 [Neorhizobium galegae]
MNGRGEAARPADLRPRIDLGQKSPGYAIYAIGDVHGCLKELLEAEARIAADMAASNLPGLVVLLGDYVDRGPDSSAVLSHLAKPSAAGLRRLALCGNHDDMFLKFIEDPRSVLTWLDFGGRETLMSYGIDIENLQKRDKVDVVALKRLLDETVPAAHIDFLRNMPSALRLGEHLFVHAGVRPGLPLEEQSEEDLLWIREPFISRGPQLPMIVVHGHTPVQEPDIGPGRIGIDTCAYATGRLTVLKLFQGETSLIC